MFWLEEPLRIIYYTNGVVAIKEERCLSLGDIVYLTNSTIPVGICISSKDEKGFYNIQLIGGFNV